MSEFTWENQTIDVVGTLTQECIACESTVISTYVDEAFDVEEFHDNIVTETVISERLDHETLLENSDEVNSGDVFVYYNNDGLYDDNLDSIVSSGMSHPVYVCDSCRSRLQEAYEDAESEEDEEDDVSDSMYYRDGTPKPLLDEDAY